MSWYVSATGDEGYPEPEASCRSAARAMIANLLAVYGNRSSFIVEVKARGHQ